MKPVQLDQAATLQAVQTHQPLAFMTGATGGLGGGVLPRLLRQRPELYVAALIRGNDEAITEKAKALCDFCELTDEESRRVIVLRGDVTEPAFGLEPALYAALTANVTDVFHLAADLRFDLPIEASRKLNVNSTQQMIDFVRVAQNNGRFHRFNYVSTAYISGERRDRARESEINVGQGFFNSYEQSKMEAEELVEAFKSSAPLTIFRPSMIIGESTTGKIRNFFGIYEFLKLANLGKVPVVPAEPDARPDLVPMDYVADALVFLASYGPAAGQTYHLAAGVERSKSIREIITLLGETVSFEKLKSIPEVVPFNLLDKLLSGNRLRLFRNSALSMLLRSYMPYLTFERHFDVEETAKLLARHGITMAPIETVLPTICRYALERDFVA